MYCAGGVASCPRCTGRIVGRLLLGRRVSSMSWATGHRGLVLLLLPRRKCSHPRSSTRVLALRGFPLFGPVLILVVGRRAAGRVALGVGP